MHFFQLFSGNNPEEYFQKLIHMAEKIQFQIIKDIIPIQYSRCATELFHDMDEMKKKWEKVTLKKMVKLQPK